MAENTIDCLDHHESQIEPSADGKGPAETGRRMRMPETVLVTAMGVFMVTVIAVPMAHVAVAGVIMLAMVMAVALSKLVLVTSAVIMHVTLLSSLFRRHGYPHLYLPA
jgi:hypothetical protein